MHRAPLLAALPLLAHTTAPAHAAGTIDRSWDACAPITVVKSMGAPQPYRLYVSMTGQADVLRGYQAFCDVAALVPAPLPDAWRFDAGGCQGPDRVVFRTLPTPAEGVNCLALQSPGPTFAITDYAYDVVTRRGRILISKALPSGSAIPNPALRYHLAAVEFDHTASVVGTGAPDGACGGFERDVIIAVSGTPNLTDPASVQHPFAAGGNAAVTYVGSGGPVPAAPTTWGAIKGHYR